jgi:hypothetical protein
MNRLAGGVVVGIAAPTHADGDAVLLQQVGILGGSVLHTAIRVMHQCLSYDAVLECHAQRG